MGSTHRESRSARRVRALEHGLLGVALLSSAMLVSVVRASPGHASLGWICLFPLFVAIRVLRPAEAGMAGILWGLSLWLLDVGDNAVLPGKGIEGGSLDIRGFVSAVAVTALPGMYAWAASWLTRRIGFSAFVLGVGWMLVELALAPLGLHNGLLGGAVAGGPFVELLARGLGYVFVAFLAAYVSALLVTSVTSVVVLLGDPAPKQERAVRNRRVCPTEQLAFDFVSAPRSLIPRAPPGSLARG